MKHFLPTSLCVVLGLATISICGAQTTPGQSNGVTAQTQSGAPPVLDEIVITAQKRTENVQDVPKVVEVLSQSQLTEAGVTNLQDLSRIDPSIQGTGAGPFAPPAIRGVSSFALSIGVQTQTGVVLDDIPQPSFSTLANELSDVERIEVLPGPQSTLSGRNAAGGLINIVTRNPTEVYKGTMTLEQTGDQQTRGAGFISGPIADTVGFSLSGFWDEWAGPLRNLALDNRRLGGFDQRGIRGKIRWAPTDGLTVTTTAFYTKGRFEATSILAGGAYVAASPTATSFLAPPGSTIVSLHPGAPIGPYNTTVSNIADSNSTNENKGASVRIDYATSVGTLSSITSYSKGEQPRVDSVLGFPLFGSSAYAYTNTDVTYKTEELRIASASDSKLKYLGGVIYTDTDNFEPYSRPVLFPVNWNRDAFVRSVAAYGQTTYEFVPDTSATLGLRYQHDHQGYTFDFADGSAPNSSNATSYQFGAFEASLQHNFTPDMKAYLTYANGQTGRAYDLEDNSDAATPAGLQPLASEKVKSYEAGMKTQWLDHRLTANYSLFWADYTDYQVQSLQLSQADPTAVPVIRLYAIGKVRIRGAQMDLNAVATENFRLGINATYLDAKILDYPGASCFAGQTVEQGCVDGLQNRRGVLPGTSKFRSTMYANYTLPMPSLPVDGTFGAFYRYQSATQYDLLGDPNSIQGGFGILNLTAGIATRSGHVRVEAFINNALNRKYYASVQQDGFAAGYAITANYARDSFRYGGVRFTGSF